MRLGVNETSVNILLIGLLSTGQAAALIEKTQELCADLAPQSLALVEAFGLPEEMLRSPIGKIIQGWHESYFLIAESLAVSCFKASISW
jgi:hypothetical protein